MSGNEDLLDGSAGRKDYKPPHSVKHKIPTIAQYRDFKHRQRAELTSEQPDSSNFPHTSDANVSAQVPGASQDADLSVPTSFSHQQPKADDKINSDNSSLRDPSESLQPDQKQRRQQMKSRSHENIRRKVTDPVTHLPVVIHDFTSKDVQSFLPNDCAENDGNLSTDYNEPLSNDGKPVSLLKVHQRADSNVDDAYRYQQSGLESMLERFPPPAFEDARSELNRVHTSSMTLHVCVLAAAGIAWLLGSCSVPLSIGKAGQSLQASSLKALLALIVIPLAGFGMWTIHTWARNQIQAIWEDAVWAAQHSKAKMDTAQGSRESTLWLSSLIGKIWPLVNPDLFASVADTLEDVMQASLPRLIRMVAVEDVGQGSEPLRILGVNWLPKGAAHKRVSEDGTIGTSSTEDAAVHSPKDVDDQDELPTDGNDNAENTENHEGVMQGEEGDFVNLEIAFAYRASRFQRHLKDLAKNAHIYLSFYLPANIKLPVWVEVKGIVGVCRARLQLTPDPPFLALCTLTFLGQPKVDLKCVPLVKRGLNIMDLPLISNFVQESIDAAVSEYVAPKSITLDLHSMLAGDDFKRDTVVRGVLMVRIHRCFDFKAGDAGIPLIRPEGSSDSYISLGWAKFARPLWSTRVIANDMEPHWGEEAFLPVGPEELDARESLRVQLWDSDKFSADDDQGRIEVDLKDLMSNDECNGKMWDRTDSFRALKADKDLPGKIVWSVGYFSKTRLLDAQVKQQEKDRDIRSVKQLKRDVYWRAKRKLREADKDESSEMKQQQHDDWATTETELISDSLPPEDYPSGILSIHVHQIVGLNLQQINQTGRDVPEVIAYVKATRGILGFELTFQYETMILNHQKVFKTRIKPKNQSPFFNAATERFVRDWRTTDLTLAVRDARVHELDPLIGFVHFNIGKHFRDRRASHSNDFYPLAGGIGYGRVRISLCFRSVQLQLPSQSLGWDLGHAELAEDIHATDLPANLRHLRLKIRTELGSGHMRPKRGSAHETTAHNASESIARWSAVGGKPLLLPVRRRHASSLTIEFRSSTSLVKKDKTQACAVLWLCELDDNEVRDLDIPIWRADRNFSQRLQKNKLPDDKCGERLGSLRLRVRFWRGFGQGHVKKMGKRNLDIQNVNEVLQAANDQGLCPPIVGSRQWQQYRAQGRDPTNDTSDTGEDSGDHENVSSEEDEEGEEDQAQGQRCSISDHRRSLTTQSQQQTGEPVKTNIDVLKTHPASFPGYSRSRVEGGTESTEESVTSISRPDRSDSAKSSKRRSGLISSAQDYLDNKAQLHRQHRGVMQWKGPRTLAWVKNKADKAIDRMSGSFEHHGREPDIETEV